MAFTISWSGTVNRCHKILQDIFYSLHANDIDDEITDLDHHVNEQQIVHHCLQQWYENDAPLVFPSKSYNVAVIYARLLEHYFKCPAQEYLQDPLLLHGRDQFYQPYAEYPELYDHLLETITYESIVASENPSVKKTIGYFNQEFMVGSCEFKLLTKEPKSNRK